MKIGEMIYFRVVMIGNIIGITKRLEGGGGLLLVIQGQQQETLW